MQRARLPHIGLERLIDFLDVEGDVLRLIQKLLGTLDRLLKLLNRGVRQARQIASLVDQHLCFVLKLGDLLIDLLQGARRCQDILRVVGRIVDDAAKTELRICRGGQHG